MRLVLNDQPDFFVSNRVVDSYHFLNCHSSRFGQVVDQELTASFVIKKHLKFFTVLTFVSAPEGVGAETFTKKLPNFIKANLPEVDQITQPMATALFPVIPDQGKGIQFGTYLLDISKPQDALMAGINGKHRNVIKNATKKGMTVEFDNKHLEKAHEIISAGYAKQGLDSQSLAFLQKMKAQLENNFCVAAGFENNECTVAAIFYFDKNRVYYYLGGKADQAVSGAMNLLMWESIKFFKSKNLQHFDFLGARLKVDENSKFYGIQKFKERFGGILFVGHFWKVSLGWKGMAYNFLLRLRSLLKTGRFKADVIEQEEGH